MPTLDAVRRKPLQNVHMHIICAALPNFFAGDNFFQIVSDTQDMYSREIDIRIAPRPGYTPRFVGHKLTFRCYTDDVLIDEFNGVINHYDPDSRVIHVSNRPATNWKTWIEINQPDWRFIRGAFFLFLLIVFIFAIWWQVHYA